MNNMQNNKGQEDHKMVKLENKDEWKAQASLVSLLIATVPNGTSLILGDRERGAMVTIIENLQMIA